MSNRTAMTFFLGIVLTLGLVLFFVEGSGIFLAQKFMDLLQVIAFWR